MLRRRIHNEFCTWQYSLKGQELGGLKTRDRKTRHGQNCRTGKRKTGKRSTKLQDWKTREKACMESQTAYSTCSSYFSLVLISVYSY